ncbi:helix-turn-helix domain-containing protein [Acetobacter musti]|uniref:Helix-turn-helix domain-containing protein n=1 Tax=Acetobacter musti TaxID=864732 RepID=A0ABX0JWG7_9PROT|nr:helix-turn-helix transcriptional regulator [Acetobacter musti]NHN86830.1 helix-turn-helix domain-containing protein [Acetobacter musti]
MMRNSKSSAEHIIGNNLSRIRRENGIALSELAAAIDISYDRIAQAEAGRVRLSPEELIAISQFLNIKLSQLLNNLQ